MNNLVLEKIVMLFIVLFLAISSFAQEYKYELYAKKNHIGNLKIKNFKTDNNLQIIVTAKVHLKFIGSINVDYSLKSNYTKGELTSANVTVYVNNKLHNQSEVIKNTDGYKIIKDGKVNEYVGTVAYSGALLYAMEPRGINQVFSEIDGMIKYMTKTADEIYELNNPKKKALKQTYTYKNGILDHAEIKHPLATFYIKSY